jgi:hypothetical protein
LRGVLGDHRHMFRQELAIKPVAGTVSAGCVFKLDRG